MPSIICQNCNHSEDLVNINIRNTSQIFMAQTPRIRQPDGLDIFPSICFKCNYITEFASDPTNESGKAIEGIEFFESKICTDNILKKMKTYASQNNLNDALQKLNKINLSEKGIEDIPAEVTEAADKNEPIHTVKSAIISIVIFGSLGFYLLSIDWKILGWISIIYTGMCLYMLVKMISGGRI